MNLNTFVIIYVRGKVGEPTHDLIILKANVEKIAYGEESIGLYLYSGVKLQDYNFNCGGGRQGKYTESNSIM